MDNKQQEQKEMNFIGFLTGLRGDTDFQVQTNVNNITVADYSEALAQIEGNVLMILFKNGGIETVAQAFALKDTILMGLIKSIEGHLDHYGLTEEEYSSIKTFFGIESIEKAIQENKNTTREEILKNMNSDN